MNKSPAGATRITNKGENGKGENGKGENGATARQKICRSCWSHPARRMLLCWRRIAFPAAIVDVCLAKGESCKRRRSFILERQTGAVPTRF